MRARKPVMVTRPPIMTTAKELQDQGIKLYQQHDYEEAARVAVESAGRMRGYCVVMGVI